MRVPATFWRFCVVGGIGFFTDAGLLELGVAAGLKPAVARAFSVAIALQVTYALHRSFTFRAERAGPRRWLRFLAANLLGAAVNYGVFLLVLGQLAALDAQAARLIALVAGTGVALVVNYTMNRLFVFAAEAG